MTLTDHGIGDDENLTANGAIADDGNPSLPMTWKGDPGGDGSDTHPDALMILQPAAGMTGSQVILHPHNHQ